MTHLSSDELIDAVEGILDAARQRHLDTCEACRHELAELSSVLHEARAVSVPEPSPLFWQHFSEQVRTAVDAEALPSRGWLRWPVLVPLGAMAMAVLALILSVPRGMDAPPSQAVNDRVANDIVTEDVALVGDSWVLVADMVGEMDWDTAAEAGLVVGPGAAEQALLELSPDEQRELTRLIRAELQRVQS